MTDLNLNNYRKSDGDILSAEDWNGVFNSIETGVNTNIEELSDRLDTLHDDLGAQSDYASDHIEALETAVSNLNSSVSNFSVADGSINTAKIADDAITTSKIVDGAVSANKLSTALKDRIYRENPIYIDVDSIEIAGVKASAGNTRTQSFTADQFVSYFGANGSNLYSVAESGSNTIFFKSEEGGLVSNGETISVVSEATCSKPVEVGGPSNTKAFSISGIINNRLITIVVAVITSQGYSFTSGCSISVVKLDFTNTDIPDLFITESKLDSSVTEKLHSTSFIANSIVNALNAISNNADNLSNITWSSLINSQNADAPLNFLANTNA